MAAAAVLVWSVVITRWPVSEAWTAILAVSGSRTSPTMMTSGSWRMKARSAVAKVSPTAGPHLRLVDAGDLVFDRVLDGEDLAGGIVQRGQRGRERRGLARTGRARHHDHAVRLGQLVGQHGAVARIEAELAEGDEAPAAIEQAQDRGFAARRRHGGDAHVEVAGPHLDAHAPVLRLAVLGDVEPGQDLDARHERAGRGRARRRDDAQHAVDPHPDLHVAAERLDVDVAGPQRHGLVEDVVERPHHGGAAREVAQAVRIVAGRPRRPRPASPASSAASSPRPPASSAISTSSKLATSSVTAPPSVIVTASTASTSKGSAAARRSVPSGAR